MKSIFILRHAKSSWKYQNLTDHERPLNKRGKKDAPRMGALLQKKNLLPDLILCSTAERARMTAKLLIEASGYEGEIRFLDELYTPDPLMYLEIISSVDNQFKNVMVIGHNPGLEELLEMLSGEWHRLTTAALAIVQLPIKKWVNLKPGVKGDLIELWRPKEL
jgi:phosphohistidine phosphatase